jgi:hypothetical protein
MVTKAVMDPGLRAVVLVVQGALLVPRIIKVASKMLVCNPSFSPQILRQNWASRRNQESFTDLLGPP